MSTWLDGEGNYRRGQGEGGKCFLEWSGAQSAKVAGSNEGWRSRCMTTGEDWGLPAHVRNKSRPKCLQVTSHTAGLFYLEVSLSSVEARFLISLPISSTII